MRLLFVLFLLPVILSGNPVVNEVMANVRGTDSGIGTPGDRNEYVEIYNCGPDTVFIGDLMITDYDAVDNIVMWPDTGVYPGGIVNREYLPPGYYGLILDPEYTMTGDSAYYMPYNIPGSAYVFTVGNTTIGDGLSANDCIMLMDNDSNTLSTYGTPGEEDDFPYDPGDGVSMERINPYYSDNYSTWLPSDSFTPGYANSVYRSGAVIDSIWTEQFSDSVRITVRFIPSTVETDTLICQTPRGNEYYAIEDSVMHIILEQGGYTLVNLHTSGCGEKHSVLIDNVRYTGSLVISEFMVKGDSEWIELYNPHSLDFHGGKLTLINNDTLIINNIEIPADSYIVLAYDTLNVKARYPLLEMNLFECDLFTLPDRPDTVQMIYSYMLLDSAVRGFENADASIERLSPGIEGYRQYNWDNSVSFRGATPSGVNSLNRESIEGENRVSARDRIITLSNPVMMLDIYTEFSSCYLTCDIYSELGTKIETVFANEHIPGIASIPVRCNTLSNGVFVLLVKIKNDEQYFTEKILFTVRR
ncbi:MAG: hypothetical protein R6U31_01100 [bacterium]